MQSVRIISDEEFDRIRDLFWLEYADYAGKSGAPEEAAFLYEILRGLYKYKKFKEQWEEME